MNARDIVTARMAAQAGRFPELEIAAPASELKGMDGREQALAAAIEHAVLRRWLTLAAVVESRLAREWGGLEPKLQACLLVGAAQMLLLDRLPDHAVINEGVEWVKRNVRPKAGGLVNAVLRKVAALRAHVAPHEVRPADLPAEAYARDVLPLHDGRCWHLTEPVFAEDPARRMAQQTSHPEAVIAHWMAAFGSEVATRIAWHSLVHAPIIVHRPVAHAGETRADFEDARVSPHEQPGFYVFRGEREHLPNLLRENDLIVQDPSSARPALASANLAPPPALVIDVCAGRGTKTKQLAALHPQAKIIATDLNPQRLGSLHAQFATHARVSVVPFAELERFRGQSDLLVLDVPCSNTGVLARRVEAKYRLSRAFLDKVIALQKQIIADALPLLAGRGSLLYATCSIEPEENEKRAEWICRWHPFRIAASESALPNGQPGERPESYTDGGYWALLEQRGE